VTELIRVTGFHADRGIWQLESISGDGACEYTLLRAPPSRESSRVPRLPRFACAALPFVSSFPLGYKDGRSPSAGLLLPRTSPVRQGYSR
jgi:hypothetical protein